MRRVLAAAAVMLLSACAGVAPPQEPPLSYPPTARERMLRIALSEWEEWGRIVVEAWSEPEPQAPGPEAAPGNFPRVLAYWRAVPEDEGAVARNRARFRRAAAGLWEEPPWSAAFISFVMRSAGVDAREFPPSPSHAGYVDALLADAAAFPATAPFVPHDPYAYAPQPGDLICADRSATPLGSWRKRAEDGGRFRPMHCDIVVARRPGVVEAVGGNVRDAVTLTRFPSTLSGVLLPAPIGAPAWFVVFENRLGRLPPWDSKPLPWSPAS